MTPAKNLGYGNSTGLNANGEAGSGVASSPIQIQPGLSKKSRPIGERRGVSGGGVSKTCPRPLEDIRGRKVTEQG